MDEFNTPLPNPLPQAGEGTNEKSIFIDEHVGKGGSYEMRDGVRVLIERAGYVPVGAQFIAPAESTDATKTTKSKVKGTDHA